MTEGLNIDEIIPNIYNRKQEIYSMLWKQVDLSKFMVAAAPFGGPLGNACHIGDKFILMVSS